MNIVPKAFLFFILRSETRVTETTFCHDFYSFLSLELPRGSFTAHVCYLGEGRREQSFEMAFLRHFLERDKFFKCWKPEPILEFIRSLEFRSQKWPFKVLRELREISEKEMTWSAYLELTFVKVTFVETSPGQLEQWILTSTTNLTSFARQ